jgi:hypothetical protein
MPRFLTGLNGPHNSAFVNDLPAFLLGEFGRLETTITCLFLRCVPGGGAKLDSKEMAGLLASRKMLEKLTARELQVLNERKTV